MNQTTEQESPMKPPARVKVVAVNGVGASPHNGRWVRHWNPHTKAGICELETTANPDKARHFADVAQVIAEYNMVSDAQPTRPWDGKPNRPLTGLTIQIETLRTLQ